MKTTNKIQTALCEANAIALQDFVHLLQQKQYSTHTIKTYRIEFGIFLNTLQQVPASSLSMQRINDYFHYCITKLNLTENQVNSRINAVKIYYEQVLQQPKLIKHITRPNQAKQLPRVLSMQDIKAMLNALSNKKHFYLLALTYGTGIKLNEIINITLADINMYNKSICIQGVNGNKDRFINFPISLENTHLNYLIEFRPYKYLFEGQYGAQYTTRSVQHIFAHAKKLANVQSPGGIHGFRHSYATHLHESGVDILMIQNLLGHKDIKSTLLYTKVSRKLLKNIVSPLDILIEKTKTISHPTNTKD